MAKKASLVVGARPNFMKAAPLLAAIRAAGNFEVELIHTGQHFDDTMSEVFFSQLGMPQPDRYLDIHGGSPAEQIGRMILALEAHYSEDRPDVVVVFGDVNSTLAASVVANKLGIRLAHVEAGLRSFDRSMPEEHNRIVTDMLADFLFTPSKDADQNLSNEGVSQNRIHFVGNIMVDSLLRFRERAEALKSWREFSLAEGAYGLVTLHRPANVDSKEAFSDIIEALVEIEAEAPLIFPIHPRSRARLEEFGLLSKLQEAGVRLVEPLGYLEFMSLMSGAGFVITDSGGIQEETTVLGVPCLTVRENTERPITIEMGSNRLVGVKKTGIIKGFKEMQTTDYEPRQPELWDGKTAARIEEILAKEIISH